jgi:hypothetical protein
LSISRRHDEAIILWSASVVALFEAAAGEPERLAVFEHDANDRVRNAVRAAGSISSKLAIVSSAQLPALAEKSAAVAWPHCGGNPAPRSRGFGQDRAERLAPQPIDQGEQTGRIRREANRDQP